MKLMYDDDGCRVVKGVEVGWFLLFFDNDK